MLLTGTLVVMRYAGGIQSVNILWWVGTPLMVEEDVVIKVEEGEYQLKKGG